MWEDVKNKFHIAYFIIIGLTILIVPWDIIRSYDSSSRTVYSLIIQPPPAPNSGYLVSISIDTLIENVISVTVIYAIVYLICKKFIYKN